MTEVIGEKEMQRKMFRLRNRIIKKAVSSGVRAGLGVMRTAIRKEIPKASVRKVIASRFKKGNKRHQTIAKVGAGVGKHKGEPGPRSKPGVGISKNNAHWYFLGTTGRFTKSGAFRGNMPKNNAVKRGAMSSRMAAQSRAAKKIREVIDKEVRKLK